MSKYVWSSDADQEYTLHFVIEFDQPIESMGGWINEKREKTEHLAAQNIKNAGVWLQFDAKKSPVVQARSGIFSGQYSKCC